MRNCFRRLKARNPKPAKPAVNKIYINLSAAFGEPENSPRWIVMLTRSGEVVVRALYTRHGKSKTRAYASWLAMRNRCLRKSHVSFHRYGGRGIEICERWNKFENFIADMGERPHGLSLDRIDNNGHYAPENCRWATASEQQANKNCRYPLIFQGQRLTLREAALRFGIAQDRLTKRLRRGWPVEEILEIVKRKRVGAKRSQAYHLGLAVK